MLSHSESVHGIKLWTNTKMRTGLSSMLTDQDIVDKDLSTVSRRLYVATYQRYCCTFPCSIRAQESKDFVSGDSESQVLDGSVLAEAFRYMNDSETIIRC